MGGVRPRGRMGGARIMGGLGKWAGQLGVTRFKGLLKKLPGVLSGQVGVVQVGGDREGPARKVQVA